MTTLSIENLHVSVDGKEILKGITLQITSGDVVVLMGPNGSGKSTLAHAIMGHPSYIITKGRILIDGKDITSLQPHERALLGLFLSFQYPHEINGVSIAHFLRTAYTAVKKVHIGVPAFHALLQDKLRLLELEPSFAQRSLNYGFSGGEKKKSEMLQLAVLEPQIAVLDETDSGLDIDALKIVAQGLKKLIGPRLGILLITHYKRILDYITPTLVHIMIDGKIVKSGPASLVNELEAKGYTWLKEEKQ